MLSKDTAYKSIKYIIASFVGAIIVLFLTDQWPDLKQAAKNFWPYLKSNGAEIAVILLLVPFGCLLLLWATFCAESISNYSINRKARKIMKDQIKHAPWMKPPERCHLCGAAKIVFSRIESKRDPSGKIHQTVWECRNCYGYTACEDMLNKQGINQRYRVGDYRQITPRY